MKKLYLLLIAFTLILCTACSDTSQQNTESDSGEPATSVSTASSNSDHRCVQLVKNGYRAGLQDLTYGEAFSDFFVNPQWQYFESRTGKDIVQFTGECIYQEVNVEARVQFVVDESANTFRATYLAFNEVPQNTLALSALIEKAFVSSGGSGSLPSSEQVTSSSPSSSSQSNSTHTYEAIKADVSWNDAKRAAESRGGHLVTINSQEEFKIVTDKAFERGIRLLWVGASLNGYGNFIYDNWGDVRWITNEPINFFNKWYVNPSTGISEPTYFSENGSREDKLMLFYVDQKWYYNDANSQETINDYKGTGWIGYVVEYGDSKSVDYYE